MRVVGRCNSALELVPRLEQEHADVVLVDDDLHLLDADRLQDLTRRRRAACCWSTISRRRGGVTSAR